MQLPALTMASCAGLNMVARYGLPHRSLYPVMRNARSNYIFCSHVGQPLSVWDKRCVFPEP